jgi:hypothetical protein
MKNAKFNFDSILPDSLRIVDLSQPPISHFSGQKKALTAENFGAITPKGLINRGFLSDNAHTMRREHDSPHSPAVVP